MKMHKTTMRNLKKKNQLETTKKRLKEMTSLKKKPMKTKKSQLKQRSLVKKLKNLKKRFKRKES